MDFIVVCGLEERLLIMANFYLQAGDREAPNSAEYTSFGEI